MVLGAGDEGLQLIARRGLAALTVAALSACTLTAPVPPSCETAGCQDPTQVCVRGVCQAAGPGGGSTGGRSTSGPTGGTSSGNSTGTTSSSSSSNSSGASSGGSSGAPQIAGLTNPIAAGDHHTCAIVNGGVQCWGENTYGQLGNNTQTFSYVPTPVQGLGNPGSGAQAVAAGAGFTCAIVNGGAQCWGENDSGQLGDNSPLLTRSLLPKPVYGLGSGVQALTAGEYYTCALVNGGVWCWGENKYGQLGNNSTTTSNIPVPVQGLGGPDSGVQALAAGGYHACALVNGGALCWGANYDGELGNDSTTESHVPIPVRGLGSPGSGVQALAVGQNHTCALVNGGLQCWGDGANGDLGDDTDAGSSVPVPVSGLGSGVQALALGYVHSCALANGTLQCWGNNDSGQIGNGSTDGEILGPVAVEGLVVGVQTIAAGGNHSCALVGGGAQCWGDNAYGDLGDNSSDEATVPVAVQGLGDPDSGVQAVAVGHDHTCALVNGGAQCWGWNASGQLGNNTTGNASSPVAVQGLESGVQALATGWEHTCALVNGGVQCWGDNSCGELGNGTDAGLSPVPVPVPSLGGGVQAVAAGDCYTCALVNGGVQCWGDNTYGELGNGASASSRIPVPVQGLEAGVQALSAGTYFACALVNGGVQCWGKNLTGQLGNNSLVSSNVPVQVQGLDGGAQALAAGQDHACALVNGGVWCWGDGSNGDVGDGSLTGSNFPIQVQGLDGGGLAIAGGDFHSCALVNGGVQCWGANGDGELGIGSMTDSSVPVPVAPWAQ